MVQTIGLRHTKSTDNPLDILQYVYLPLEPESDLYILAHMSEENSDIFIYSIHDRGIKPKGKNNVGVVSYVPEINSDEWPSFYVALCLAPIIACDSFVANQLKSITFPYKPIFNLDGIYPPNWKPALKYDEDEITIGCVQSDSAFWQAAKAIIPQIELEDDVAVKFKPVNKLSDAIVAFSTREIGMALSNTLAAAYRAWIPQGPSTVFLDSRLTHNFAEQIARLESMSGGVTAQIALQLTKTMLQELGVLLAHNMVSPVPTFTSSNTLVSRIFNEYHKAR